MKHSVLQDIRNVAKKDFESIASSIKKQKNITASVQDIRFVSRDDVVTATCSFEFQNEVIEASINYGCDEEGIYSDASVGEVTSAVLGTLKPVMAADDDEMLDDPIDDSFDFDDVDEEDSSAFDDEEVTVLEEGEMEDPESSPDIETENNIAGHYIVECDRCHGVFISALVESDQVVDHINGVCPLCEKESDQYIKWVVKPVEF